VNDKIELAKLSFLQLNRRERKEFLSAFADKAPATPSTAAPRLLRRREVAERLSRSERAVDRLAAEGTLRKIRLPGRARAAGFLEAEVVSLMAGED
jgi:predicted DNA-binding transcriptional regulator AlpA